jgi:negative regulator of flagellin synthesis FlgM
MDVTKLRSDKIADAQAGAAQSSQKSKATSQTVSREVSANSTKPAAGFSSENVNLSAEAGLLAEGVSAAKAAPDVRAERVASLKAAIKNGTYKPDAHAIAGKMIETHLEESLLARKG